MHLKKVTMAVCASSRSHSLSASLAYSQLPCVFSKIAIATLSISAGSSMVVSLLTVCGTDGKLAVSPPLTAPLPLNAVALDTDAALQMCMWYDEAATIVGGWHHLHFHPSI